MGCSSSQTAPAWSFPIPQGSGRGCCSRGVPWAHSSFGHHPEQGGALLGLQPGLCSPMGCRWISPLTLMCLLPFSPALGGCRVHTCSSLPAAVLQQAFSFPKYITPEALRALLMGSALASSLSLLEQAGAASARHEGRSFWHLCTEVSHPCSPPLPKPGHTNLVQVRTQEPAGMKHVMSRLGHNLSGSLFILIICGLIYR